MIARILSILLVASTAFGQAYITSANLTSANHGGSTGGGGAFSANAVTYVAASNQYLTKSGGAVAGSDSGTLTFSCWINPSDANTRDVVSLGSWPVFFCGKKGVGTMQITAATSAGTTLLDVTSSLTWTQSAWNHVFLAADLSNSSKRVLYINGVLDTGATWTTYTAGNIGWSYAAGNHGIANNGVGGSLYGGCIAEAYLAAGQYNTNVTLWASSGHPVSLGSDGSVPTGSQPNLYLKDPAATAGNNSGSMGNFTINGGPLSSCTAP